MRRSSRTPETTRERARQAEQVAALAMLLFWLVLVGGLCTLIVRRRSSAEQRPYLLELVSGYIENHAAMLPTTCTSGRKRAATVGEHVRPISHQTPTPTVCYSAAPFRAQLLALFQSSPPSVFPQCLLALLVSCRCYFQSTHHITRKAYGCPGRCWPLVGEGSVE